VLFDTDVLIWLQRGSIKAARKIDSAEKRFISIQTYMELLQTARSKEQQSVVKAFLKDYDFEILPLTENIGHRAAIYIEQLSMSHGLRAGDAIIAATAAESNIRLMSANKKHFMSIPDIAFTAFIP